MSISKVFKMPKTASIAGRMPTITNSFVNSIIPVIVPSEREIEESLKILGLDKDDLRCAYCGDRATEWDHFRPIVAGKKPTGHISEIHNLVPACGKCNQSKGGKYWKEWIRSDAKLSPKKRGVANLNNKIRRLEVYETWGKVRPQNFEHLVSSKLWKQHWKNCENLHMRMREAHKIAIKIRGIIGEQFKKRYKRMSPL